MKNFKADWSKFTGMEATATNNNEYALKYSTICRIEIQILKSHNIIKSCYHNGDLKINYVHILIA